MAETTDLEAIDTVVPFVNAEDVKEKPSHDTAMTTEQEMIPARDTPGDSVSADDPSTPRSAFSDDSSDEAPTQPLKQQVIPAVWASGDEIHRPSSALGSTSRHNVTWAVAEQKRREREMRIERGIAGEIRNEPVGTVRCTSPLHTVRSAKSPSPESSPEQDQISPVSSAFDENATEQRVPVSPSAAKFPKYETLYNWADDDDLEPDSAELERMTQSSFARNDARNSRPATPNPDLPEEATEIQQSAPADAKEEVNVSQAVSQGLGSNTIFGIEGTESEADEENEDEIDDPERRYAMARAAMYGHPDDSRSSISLSGLDSDVSHIEDLELTTGEETPSDSITQGKPAPGQSDSLDTAEPWDAQLSPTLSDGRDPVMGMTVEESKQYDRRMKERPTRSRTPEEGAGLLSKARVELKTEKSRKTKVFRIELSMDEQHELLKIAMHRYRNQREHYRKERDVLRRKYKQLMQSNENIEDLLIKRMQDGEQQAGRIRTLEAELEAVEAQASDYERVAEALQKERAAIKEEKRKLKDLAESVKAKETTEQPIAPPTGTASETSAAGVLSSETTTATPIDGRSAFHIVKIKVPCDDNSKAEVLSTQQYGDRDIQTDADNSTSTPPAQTQQSSDKSTQTETDTKTSNKNNMPPSDSSSLSGGSTAGQGRIVQLLPPDANRWPQGERDAVVPFMVDHINSNAAPESSKVPLTSAQLSTILGDGRISWTKLIEKLRELGYWFKPDRLALSLVDTEEMNMRNLPVPSLEVIAAALGVKEVTPLIREMVQEVANLLEAVTDRDTAIDSLTAQNTNLSIELSDVSSVIERLQADAEEQAKALQRALRHGNALEKELEASKAELKASQQTPSETKPTEVNVSSESAAQQRELLEQALMRVADLEKELASKDADLRNAQHLLLSTKAASNAATSANEKLRSHASNADIEVAELTLEKESLLEQLEQSSKELDVTRRTLLESNVGKFNLETKLDGIFSPLPVSEPESPQTHLETATVEPETTNNEIDELKARLADSQSHGEKLQAELETAKISHQLEADKNKRLLERNVKAEDQIARWKVTWDNMRGQRQSQQAKKRTSQPSSQRAGSSLAGSIKSEDKDDTDRATRWAARETDLQANNVIFKETLDRLGREWEVKRKEKIVFMGKVDELLMDRRVASRGESARLDKIPYVDKKERWMELMA